MPKRNYDFYNRAIQLRKLGYTYSEIQKEFYVSKSTLSEWLSKLELSEDVREALKEKSINVSRKNQRKGALGNKLKRQRELISVKENAREFYESTKHDAIFIAGLMLYWGEGAKTHKRVEFINSDPNMLKFALSWSEKYLGISRGLFKCFLNIHSDQNDEDIKKFWSKELNMGKEQFGKTYIKPASTGYKKNKLYFGTNKLGFNSSDWHYTILYWLEFFKNEYCLGR